MPDQHFFWGEETEKGQAASPASSLTAFLLYSKLAVIKWLKFLRVQINLGLVISTFNICCGTRP